MLCLLEPALRSATHLQIALTRSATLCLDRGGGELRYESWCTHGHEALGLRLGADAELAQFWTMSKLVEKLHQSAMAPPGQHTPTMPSSNAPAGTIVHSLETCVRDALCNPHRARMKVLEIGNCCAAAPRDRRVAAFRSAILDCLHPRLRSSSLVQMAGNSASIKARASSRKAAARDQVMQPSMQPKVCYFPCEGCLQSYESAALKRCSRCTCISRPSPPTPPPSCARLAMQAPVYTDGSHGSCGERSYILTRAFEKKNR